MRAFQRLRVKPIFYDVAMKVTHGLGFSHEKGRFRPRGLWYNDRHALFRRIDFTHYS